MGLVGAKAPEVDPVNPTLHAPPTPSLHSVSTTVPALPKRARSPTYNTPDARGEGKKASLTGREKSKTLRVDFLGCVRRGCVCRINLYGEFRDW